MHTFANALVALRPKWVKSQKTSHYRKPMNAKTFLGSCLKTGQQSIFVIIRKILKLIHVCWIPQIDDFIFIMEQYFHY